MAVAHALGPLRDRVVFVGGATVNLYSMAATATPEPRTTDDVDCIVEVAPRSAFYQLEEELRELGFSHAMEANYIGRWKSPTGLTVDMIPTSPEILGFSNPWYPAGFALAEPYVLPDATSIRILSPPYFLATKLVALRDRGWPDLWTSQDLEDIVHVLDNRPALPIEVSAADPELRTYVSQQVVALLSRPELLDVLEGVLPPGSGYERKYEIERRLRQLLAS
ncbi:nucleotidyl transferase AbiEii/AbiGii toxin family protein [Hymenobacter cavernae]|uniref:Nucleotidyl transferase AbiEii/AbiGii toxin family protein n=1 Tax=Hymenobacter cavernae TaxID=2044852 RepID=A0ABQ1UXJ7_9BACT|nr:nucleotidyl transferase AbiEii/AbiGii toxin family protein [Hymenobacter cavernae]GGF27915.1 hypothetical protein GCM10011383_44520 [Hymenobacter cavernae]